MARPNVDLVRSVYAWFDRGDLDAVFDALHGDVEIAQSTELPWGGVYEGHDGARTFFQALTSRIRSRVTVDHFVDAGQDVVAIGRTEGTVLASGQTFSVPIAHVWTLRDGRVARVRFYVDDPTMHAALTR